MMLTEEDAALGPAVQHLASKDIHLIAGAIADIVRSSSLQLTASLAPPSSRDNTTDTHEGIFLPC